MFNPAKALFKYLREAKEELQKVTWPTQKQTMQYSVIVIALSVLLAVYFGVADYFLQLGFNALVDLSL